jgi:hypothetical protein
MTSRKVTKLFAVVALTTGTAAAGPDHAHHRHQDKPQIETPKPQPTAEEEKAAVEAARELLGVWIPRMLKSGGPACGNVQGKSQRRCPWES